VFVVWPLVPGEHFRPPDQVLEAQPFQRQLNPAFAARCAG
jgi:hypothetical protein